MSARKWKAISIKITNNKELETRFFALHNIVQEVDNVIGNLLRYFNRISYFQYKSQYESKICDL